MTDATSKATSSSLSFAERVARAEAALIALRGPMTASVLEASRHLDEVLAGCEIASDQRHVPPIALDLAHNLKGLAGTTGSAEAAAMSNEIYDQLLKSDARGTEDLAAIRVTMQRLQAHLVQMAREHGA